MQQRGKYGYTEIMKKVVDTKLKRMYKKRNTKEESEPPWMWEEIKI